MIDKNSKVVKINESKLVDLINDIVEKTIVERNLTPATNVEKKPKKITVTEAQLRELQSKGAKINSIVKKKRLTEAINKSLEEFGMMLDDKLSTIGFETKLMRGSNIDNNVSKAISGNDKLAALILNGDNYLTIVVNSSRMDSLSKLLSKFELTKDVGNMTGADKGGWSGKAGHVKNSNPGDISLDGQGGMNGYHWVKFIRQPQGQQQAPTQ
jgi:hypothetical protein